VIDLPYGFIVMEAPAPRFQPYLAVAAIGAAAAFIRELVVGFLAARPWPRWYIPWAHTHKHLAVQLSWIVMALVPSMLIAIACGGLLAVLWRGGSKAVVLLAAVAWLAYDLCRDVIADIQVCLYPVQCFLEPFRLEPISSAIGMMVPAATLLLAYRWMRHT
jgi:hypothetical protein